MYNIVCMIYDLYYIIYDIYIYTFDSIYIFICIVGAYPTHDWARMWPIPTYYSGSPTSKKD